ncbi:MAG: hypothetical protein KDI30_05475, partial [Pseudomonadales bacterium]|nr:hypothetical protein [Pseudomonadales bacterium]
MKKAVINSLPKAGTNLVARILDLCGYTDTAHIGPFIRSRTLRNFISSNLDALTTRQQIDCGIDRLMNQNRGKVLKLFSNLRENEYLSAHLNCNDDLLNVCKANNLKVLIVIR